MFVNQAESDSILIEQVLSGNKMAYNQLVEKHQQYAFTIAYNILKVREDAEEVAHDAFIKAYKNLDRFSGEAKFSTWLYRIVFNTAISAKRKVKVKKEDIENHYSFFAESTNRLEEDDKRKFINQALIQLNALDQTVITLFYLKEQSIEEIAQITEMNPTTIKVRLHRARKRLADELKGILNEEALTL